MIRTEIVETTLGKVQGYIEKGIKIFKGIPYAAPPIGNLRFSPPIPREPWSDIFMADKFGSIAPQPPFVSVSKQLKHSEAECLNLNIWTPGIDQKKRPVMFWIHGGGFMYESSADRKIDGSALALKGNVIVVSINYRLGPLGFLYIPGITANVGMLDQIAALKWVRDNIRIFGGDPNNVTIFGESAGATAVVSLLAMPAAKGLFHRAIVQSYCVYYVSNQERGSKEFISKLGFHIKDIKSLQKLPVNKLIDTFAEFMEDVNQRDEVESFVPVIDDKTLPEYPLKAVSEGFSRDIPLLIGTNKDEMTINYYFLSSIPKINDDELLNSVCKVLRKLGQNESKAKQMIKVYKDENRGIALQDILYRFLTDLWYRIISIRLAEAQSNYQPHTFMYLFTWSSPDKDGTLGATHTLEIPFIFGTLNKPNMDSWTGKGKKANNLSDKMMKCWIAFAHTGNPNHKDIPKWPAYEVENRATMNMGKKFKILNAPFDKERAAWDGIHLS
ncbi:MAG: carboxylesterase/lipase family protein [Candidatus Heimdallarchaeota archaeon]